jgi:histidinol-phosphate aminotransferase
MPFMIDKISSRVKEIPPYIPGKRKEEIARKYGISLDEIVKLASNENPLGPPPKAVEILKENAGEVSVYPDNDARELRSEIADYTGLDEKNIIVGNGSDEVLELTVKLFLDKGDEAIIPIPTFSVYNSLVKIYAGKPVYVPLDDGFNFNVDKIIENISKKTKLVFICSPNNPSGSVLSEDGLLKILEEDVVVVLDEAYAEFSDVSNIGKVSDYENLIVTRTFSKAFGLAGLRIGYGAADDRIIDYMFRVKTPFSVNLLAQKAAIAALKDREHLKKTVELVRRERDNLISMLGKLPKIAVYPSQANFVLINMRESGMSSRKIVDALLRKGVIVRDCSSFYGMDEYHIRVSIGKPEENKRFFEAFSALLSKK